MGFHKNAPASDVHIPYSFTYADAPTREGATGLLVTDQGKLARQLDTNGLYMLTNHSPVEWADIADYQGPVDFGSFQMTTGNVNPGHVEGLVFYDDEKNALSYYNEVAEVTINTGQEVVFPVLNNSGSLITNGSVVSPAPSGIILADRHIKNRCRLIAVATHDIADGAWGYVTRLGQVGGLDTSSFSLEIGRAHV